jgi:CheY-like chemotaxis protein
MRTILIADHDEKIRNLVGFAFTEDMGYKVVTAATGEEAIAIAKQLTPDVIISNVTIPGKNGYEVSREIKSDGSLKNKYVILLSTPSSLDERKASDSHADDVIIIPPDSTNIIGEIGERLETFSRSGKKKLLTTRRVILMIPITFAVLLFVFLSQKYSLHEIKDWLGPATNSEKGKKVVISVNGEDGVYIEFTDRKKYNLPEFKALVASLKDLPKAGTDDEPILLRTSSSVSYNTLIDIMRIMKRAGVKKVKVVMESVVPLDLDNIIDADIGRDVSSSPMSVETNTSAGAEGAGIPKSNRLTNPEESLEGRSSIHAKEPKADGLANQGDLLNISGKRANIRSGPGMSYNVIGVVMDGEKLENLHEESASWIKIKTHDGKAGWVWKKWFKVLSE